MGWKEERKMQCSYQEILPGTLSSAAEGNTEVLDKPGGVIYGLIHKMMAESPRRSGEQPIS